MLNTANHLIPAVAIVFSAVVPLCRASVVTYTGAPGGLQVALDGLSPGDVILVPPATYPPITIRKPITIVGNPSAVFDSSATNSNPPITLDGPGAGRVVLSRLATKGYANAWIVGHLGSTNDGVQGGGFSELHILDSTIDAPTFSIDPVDGSFAGMKGGDGIHVDVDFLLIERSYVYGSAAVGLVPPATAIPEMRGGDGIEAPGATIVVLDSYIAGGTGPNYTNLPGDGALPAEPCAPIEWGVPGYGVNGSVSSSNSTIVGGTGGSAFCDQTHLFNFPGAPAVLGAWLSLPNNLSAEPIVNGSTWTLSWTGTAAIIFLGSPQPPMSVSGHLLFLQPSSLTPLVTIVGSSATVPVNVPSDLVGLEVAVQAGIPPGTLSRPIVSVILE